MFIEKFEVPLVLLVKQKYEEDDTIDEKNFRYLDYLITHNGTAKLDYFYPDDSTYGRKISKVRKSDGKLMGMGLQMEYRKVRHALCISDPELHDIDIVNCYQIIFAEICKRCKLAYPNLENYNKNRQEYFDLIGSKDITKKIINEALHNGKGTFNDFYETCKELNTKTKIKNLVDEIKSNVKQLADHDEYKDIYINSIPKKGKNNKYGTFISKILGRIEEQYLNKIIEIAKNQKAEIVSLCFDGCIIRCSNEIANAIVEQVNKENEGIFSITRKAFDEGYKWTNEELEEFRKQIQSIDPEIAKMVNGLNYSSVADYIIKHIDKFGSIVSVDFKLHNFYYYENNFWKKDLCGNNLISLIKDTYLYELILNFGNNITNINPDLAAKAFKLINLLRSAKSMIKDIVSDLSRRLYDPNFFGKLDKNPDLFAFDDCVMDLKAKQILQHDKSHMISKTCKMNFPNLNNKNLELERFIQMIQPNLDSRNYLIKILAQTLSGRSYLEHVYNHIGGGSNGKTMLLTLLSMIFGDYGYELPVKRLCESVKSGAADPEIGELNGIRAILSSEPKKNQKIDETFIKSTSSNETVKFRELFSNVIQKFNIQGRIHLFSNFSLQCDGSDYALQRRLKEIPYISTFVDMNKIQDVNPANNVFLKDLNLKDNFQNWKSDFMAMLINNYTFRWDYDEPELITKRTLMYFELNNPIQMFINNNIEITNSKHDYLTIESIYEKYKVIDSKISYKVFQSDIIRIMPIVCERHIGTGNRLRFKIGKQLEQISNCFSKCKFKEVNNCLLKDNESIISGLGIE